MSFNWTATAPAPVLVKVTPPALKIEFAAVASPVMVSTAVAVTAKPVDASISDRTPAATSVSETVIVSMLFAYALSKSFSVSASVTLIIAVITFEVTASRALICVTSAAAVVTLNSVSPAIAT